MKVEIKESSQNQPATAGQNAISAATSRENEKPTAVGEQTGGELAAAPCSASEVSDKHYCSHVVPDGYDGLEFCSDIGRIYISRTQWELSQPYFNAWREKAFSSPEWKPQELRE